MDHLELSDQISQEFASLAEKLLKMDPRNNQAKANLIYNKVFNIFSKQNENMNVQEIKNIFKAIAVAATHFFEIIDKHSSDINEPKGGLQ